jgi:protein farnesyltransferase/geranylgeranyltransferase type-1 subunit alpha
LQDEERRFTEAMINRDVRNNSAWNQRFVVTFSENDQVTNEALKRTVDSELAFVSRKIEIAPDNESAWNYLRGVARVKTNDDVAVTKRVEEIARAHCSVTLSEMNALFREKEEEDVVPMDANDGDDGPPSRNTRGASKETEAKTSSDTNDSRHAVSLLADVSFSSGDCVSAAALYERLAHRDPIRANYWTHMRDETRRSRG